MCLLNVLGYVCDDRRASLISVSLGIDNLIFIAILAEKLPPATRDKARIIGLSLALAMRLGLLSVMSWLVTLTSPLFSIGSLSLSGRDFILLLGGIFLLFKATVELHERLEGVPHATGSNKPYTGFWLVVTQIVILDAVFSLDAVITAVGMVDELGIMMTAVVISVGIMLLASKPLTRFVNAHPTVVVLCLSFLLMIGLSLVAEGVGFHIPKGYLYAAIGFSIVIESFNQFARRNQLKIEARRPMRERTAEAILALLASKRPDQESVADDDGSDLPSAPTFANEERDMVSGVLSLADRTVRSIMTPRTEVSWINISADVSAICRVIMETPHSLFPVCDGQLDNIEGIARAKDVLYDISMTGHVDLERSVRAPLVVVDSTGILKLMDMLRHARGQLALVTDEYGVLQGVVTPVDVLEAIAGEFPDEDELPTIEETAPGRWLAAGAADLRHAEQLLGIPLDSPPGADYSSLAGFMLGKLGELPVPGQSVIHEQYRFVTVEVHGSRNGCANSQIYPSISTAGVFPTTGRKRSASVRFDRQVKGRRANMLQLP
ncbi:TerC family protein [Burkholderia cenocepacia]|uniref:TerC family protein n=1 Tax=Burkholderia cenocepacia TaxID=95486 RepID=UPI001B963E27|nr:TerC family protein [Burkholderia cenocepacia]MBR8442935.1 TerC family protein [Burkholderia cenocepacia]